MQSLGLVHSLHDPVGKKMDEAISGGVDIDAISGGIEKKECLELV
jgi:hypothetical protein